MNFDVFLIEFGLVLVTVRFRLYVDFFDMQIEISVVESFFEFVCRLRNYDSFYFV